jgi:hypothetical protein
MEAIHKSMKKILPATWILSKPDNNRCGSQINLYNPSYPVPDSILIEIHMNDHFCWVQSWLWDKGMVNGKESLYTKELNSIEDLLLEGGIPLRIKEWFIHNLQLFQV